MKGIIHNINKQRAMVAVLTEQEDYSIFEMLGYDDFDIGDEVSWIEDNPSGGCEVKNISKNTTIEVLFQNHYISEKNVKQQLLF
jgi:hypothetical protein